MNPCAPSLRGSRNTSPKETSTTPGATPGTREELGNRFLLRVHGTCGRSAESGRPGDWPSWSSATRQDPLHLIHGGGLVLCTRNYLMPAGRKRLRESVTAARIDNYPRRKIRGAIAPDDSATSIIGTHYIKPFPSWLCFAENCGTGMAWARWPAAEGGRSRSTRARPRPR